MSCLPYDTINFPDFPTPGEFREIVEVKAEKILTDFLLLNKNPNLRIVAHLCNFDNNIGISLHVKGTDNREIVRTAYIKHDTNINEYANKLIATAERMLDYEDWDELS